MPQPTNGRKIPESLSPKEVENRIEKALDLLFRNDAFLLEHSVGERTVAAKLACYMAPLFAGYSVDAEYNREGIDPRHAKSVKTELLQNCKSVKKAVKDGKPTVRVFPDIIVHTRGEKEAGNLLVVEIKRESNPEPRACDEAKIDVMLMKYKYRYGLFLRLPSGHGAATRKPTKRWFGVEAGQFSQPPTVDTD